MDALELYQQWCTDPYFDEETQKELKADCGRRGGNQRSFLEAAGIRYRRPAGGNRCRNQPDEHLYGVRQATQGLAN